MRVNIKVHARSKRESVTPQPDGSLKVQAQVLNGESLCTKLSLTFSPAF